jgi:hypothetical protein
MDELRLTRSYLETLSTGDLAQLAERLGLDIPSDLNRIFVIEELLETDTEIDRALIPEDNELAVLPADGDAKLHLPDRYNATFIEVLLRDPAWVFTFWEIRSQDRDFYEGAPDFGGYHLRLSSLDALPLREGKSSPDSFIISVEPTDSAWYLSFPSSQGLFKVELCVLKGKNEIVLAVSPPLRVPMNVSALSVLNGQDDSPQTKILNLSGWDDFHVLRTVDHVSRLPQRCE